MSFAPPGSLARGPSASGPSPVRGSLVLEPGTVIATKYVLERPAGFGGMAKLWVATNQSTGAEVCIKLLVPDAADEEDGTPKKLDDLSLIHISPSPACEHLQCPRRRRA